MIGFKDTDKLNKKTEIGYWLSEKFQKQGINLKIGENDGKETKEYLGHIKAINSLGIYLNIEDEHYKSHNQVLLFWKHEMGSGERYSITSIKDLKGNVLYRN